MTPAEQIKLYESLDTDYRDDIDDPYPLEEAPSLTGWRLVGAWLAMGVVGWGFVYVIAQGLIRVYEAVRALL